MFNKFILLVLIICFPLGAVELEAQRKLFVKAESAARSGKVSTYNKMLKQLADYPLAPYVELAYLSKHPYLSNKEKIRDFLALYQGTPLEWPLRAKWLEYLAKKNKPLLFINDFKPTSNAELNCQFLRSELAIGAKIKDISKQVEKLWVVGKSQPKACDPLFKQWKDAGLIEQSSIKNRIKLAADGGSHSLIPYLTKLLVSDSDKTWAKKWHRVRKNPAYITQISRFKSTEKDDIDIQYYGLKRLIWRDPDAAIKHWHTYAKQIKLSAAQIDQIKYTFALALASKQHEDAKIWLKQVPKHKIDNQIAHWHLATYLVAQDWIEVASLIQSLPESIVNQSIYQYWLSRAQDEIGVKHTAKDRLGKLAQSRHYYGFLAAAQVNSKPKLNHQGYPLNQLLVDKLAEAPGAKRAYEFLQLERHTSARREWNQFKLGLSKEEQAAAAYLASQWHWYDQALRGISQAGYHNDVEIRFPFAFADSFKTYSDKAGIDSTLAMAISRRESSFMSDANSSAGALGLMQLMPGTAKMLYGKRINKYKLFDANTNIKLGTQYIGQLIERLSDRVPLAIASYNAGYYRVKKWIPEDKPQPLDIWIETIPYKETREYVKAVLAYQQVYELMTQQPEYIFNDLVKQQVVKSAG